MINEILAEKHMTRYRLSKLSGVPHATLADICSGKALLHKASAQTVYQLARVLNVSVEQLVTESLRAVRPAFSLFRSQVCHRLKDMGDQDFLIDVFQRDEIAALRNEKRVHECLYLLALCDYLCRIHGYPLAEKYHDLRNMKLAKPLYPTGVRLIATLSSDEKEMQSALQNSIPEFMRFGIVECEVRDVH